MISFNELKDIDIDILKFVLIHHPNPVSLNSIHQKFNNSKTIDFRINLLSKQDRKHLPHMSIPIKNTAYLIPLYDDYQDELGITHQVSNGYVKITDLGIKAIEDYDVIQKRKYKQTLEDRFFKFAPLIISILSFLFSIFYRPWFNQMLYTVLRLMRRC